MAMAFYPFLYSQEEKLNLVVNKAILIQPFGTIYLPYPPPPPFQAFLRIIQIFSYICLVFILLFRFDKAKSDKSQKMSISVLIHLNFANILNFGVILGFADVY